MDFHEILMKGPLNTDNIRASDGTLAATVADSTGDVNFQNDIEARDIDARRNLVVFNNLTVQGPLASFVQAISVGTDASITRDLSVGRNANVTEDITAGVMIQTPDLRVTGNSPAAGRLLTAVDGAGNVTWGTGGTAGIASVPTGQSILFYTNDTVLGYTILDVADDDVVYVTKGTIHSGEAGGIAKPGSTWFQATHVHATRPHTLTTSEIPPHRHPADGATQNFMGSHGNTHGEGGDAYGVALYTGYAGGGAAHSHQNTFSASTPNTWRPKGRNFTLQQRN